MAGQSNVVLSLRDTIVRGTAPWKALAAAEVKRPVASIHIYRVGDPSMYLPVCDCGPGQTDHASANMDDGWAMRPSRCRPLFTCLFGSALCQFGAFALL